MAFQLVAKDFQDSAIPKRFTCDGLDHSSELSWTDPPKGTASFALIVKDPDAPAGTWFHWLLYDLPTDTRELPEGMPKSRSLPSGAHQGRNDFGRFGYNGPCPPKGRAHRYFFTLYALDSKTNLGPGAGKNELESAIRGHVLAEAEVIGIFQH